MQDDCYLISINGWEEAVLPHEITKIKIQMELVWPKEDVDYQKESAVLNLTYYQNN